VSAHITNYLQARYILLWEELAYVTHSANLSEYMRVITIIIITETSSMCEMFPQSHMRKLLEVDTSLLLDTLDSLRVHHRIARSLDFLGSMLKVVAGTPDAGDLERVKFTEWYLTQSNNRQIKINTRIQSRINQ